VVGDPDHPTAPAGYREHYIRDAQGNVMASYRFEKLPVTEPDPGFEASLKLTERPIYGSARLGVDAHALELGGLGPEDPNPYLLEDPIGKVNYELTDHLGNVTTVITDELIGVDIQDNASAFEYFQPFVLSATRYEAFGSPLPNGLWDHKQGAPTLRLLRMLEAGESIEIDLDGTPISIPYNLAYTTIEEYLEEIRDALLLNSVTATVVDDALQVANWPNNSTISGTLGIVAMESGSYAAGFNGQLKDNEMYGSEGTSYTAEFWQYDTRVGRRWNIDPILHYYQSNYAVFSNNPMIFVDPNGKADFYNKRGKWIGTDGNTDGKRYVSSNHKMTREIRNTSKSGDFVTLKPAEHRSLLKVPSPAVRQMMEVHLNKTTRTGAEHGGHAGQDGVPVSWDPGQGFKEHTSKDGNEFIKASVRMFKINGQEGEPPADLGVTWHTHPPGGSGYASDGDYTDEAGHKIYDDVDIQKVLEIRGHTNDAIVIGPAGGVRYYDGQGDRGSAGTMKNFLGIGTEKSDNSRIRKKFDSVRNNKNN
jgi:hypothetical protein